MSGSVPDRIRAKIFDSASGCWLWKASTNRQGYGMAWNDGKMHLAHRLIYETILGPVPEGMHLHHKCKIKKCVNPWHLGLLTASEHMRLHPDRNMSWRLKMSERTHCAEGHEMTPENTYSHPAGRRVCRICRREKHTVQQRARRAVLRGEKV